MDELQQDNIQLVLVSIGVPEKARQLMDHLNCLPRAHEIFFVDPDNALYDALDLNRGVQRTFFNVNTPQAFLRRIVAQQQHAAAAAAGTQDLLLVLQNWSRAAYVPPKPAQALLQGGTLLFCGRNTVYAHYDPSTAAHANMDRVLQLARQYGMAEKRPT